MNTQGIDQLLRELSQTAAKASGQEPAEAAGTANFAANYYGDQNMLQFSTARDGNIANVDSEKPKMNSRFVCDIYTLKKSEGKWGTMEKIHDLVNSSDHEAAGFLTTDRSNFYFTRWATSNKNECFIYRSRLMNGIMSQNEKWFSPEKLNEKIISTFFINGNILYNSIFIFTTSRL